MRDKNANINDAPFPKAKTGVTGLDAAMHGGLPRGRTTLIEGGPGSGKTVLALQTLVNGAKTGEPAIFVAFEESSARIVANAASFGWDLPKLQSQKLFFLDAQPNPSMLLSGPFDLGGMLAALDHKVKELGAKRIVFDAIDMVLDLFGDRQTARNETYRLHDWLNERELTTLITAKASPKLGGMTSESLEFLQFMVDCSIFLRQDVVEATSQRSIRIGKYRGSAFEENVTPLGIGPNGVEVAYCNEITTGSPAAAPTERISSGVERLDTMLEGGYYRGAGILITGAPGTAKTTLAGAFAKAAAERGERTLFVSLDSPGNEVIRNLRSVGIDLEGHVTSGMLAFEMMRSSSASGEMHLMRIRDAAKRLGAKCIVVDPLSALAKAGNQGTSAHVIERLIDWAKGEGVTLLATSLLAKEGSVTEGSPLQVSTLADTWIDLSYKIQAGERNRAISIIKSRGTGHSNQVRELILDTSGITLADVYTAGGDVLMGALRWEREATDAEAIREKQQTAARRKIELETEAIELQGRIATLERSLQSKRTDIAALDSSSEEERTRTADGALALHALRHGDR